MQKQPTPRVRRNYGPFYERTLASCGGKAVYSDRFCTDVCCVYRGGRVPEHHGLHLEADRGEGSFSDHSDHSLRVAHPFLLQVGYERARKEVKK